VGQFRNRSELAGSEGQGGQGQQSQGGWTALLARNESVYIAARRRYVVENFPTLLRSEGCDLPGGEPWIENSGAFDGVIDFDRVLRDPDIE